MPTKKPSLFEVTGKEPPKEKLPTLTQYLKQLPKETQESDLISPVRVIWFPGNWENYSVETRKFRVSISSSHSLYKTLDATIMQFLDRDTSILLRIVDRQEFTIGFVEGGEYGKWSRIGNAGLVFEPTSN